jgi:hypothetical protein
MFSETVQNLGVVRPLAELAVTRQQRSLADSDRLADDDREYRRMVYNAHAVVAVGAAQVCIVPFEAWFTDPGVLLARLVTPACADRNYHQVVRANNYFERQIVLDMLRRVRSAIMVFPARRTVYWREDSDSTYVVELQSDDGAAGR